MPVYEFFCPDCNTIFNFLSRKIDTETTPGCPKCKQETLTRKVSLFAAIGSKTKDSTEGSSESGDGGDDPFAGMNIDESKMERAVEALSGEMEGIDENDPRAAANLMRKFSDMAGLQFNDKIDDALNRMEAGEDPESLEKEMGDSLENPFLPSDKRLAKKRTAPMRDDTLYEM